MNREPFSCERARARACNYPLCFASVRSREELVELPEFPNAYWHVKQAMLLGCTQGTHCGKIPIFVQKIQVLNNPILAVKFKFKCWSRFYLFWIFGPKLRFCISVQRYVYYIYCYALHHHPALLLLNLATKRFSHNPEKFSLAIAVLVFTTIDKMKYSIVSWENIEVKNHSFSR